MHSRSVAARRHQGHRARRRSRNRCTPAMASMSPLSATTCTGSNSGPTASSISASATAACMSRRAAKWSTFPTPVPCCAAIRTAPISKSSPPACAIRKSLSSTNTATCSPATTMPMAATRPAGCRSSKAAIAAGASATSTCAAWARGTASKCGVWAANLQPAFVVPPLAHIANGPAGFTYYPGTGQLPDRYQDHFFLVDFRGSSGGSGIHAFALKPKGASFEMIDRHHFVWSVLATDCDFGPDGAFYLSDWVEGWDLTNKGRIYKVGDPVRANDPAVLEVKKLLAEGMGNGPLAELGAAPGAPRHAHPARSPVCVGGSTGRCCADGRLRTRAARWRACTPSGGWGKSAVKRRTPTRTCMPLLDDPDAEVRAQALKVLADDKDIGTGARQIGAGAPGSGTARALLCRASTGQARQRRRYAGDSGHGSRQCRQGRFPPPRRGDGAGGHSRPRRPCASERRCCAGRAHGRRCWRCAGSKCRKSPAFCTMSTPRSFLEAARAIYEMPIPAALPALAALLSNRPAPGPMSAPALKKHSGLRALNANFRLGQKENIKAIAHVRRVGIYAGTNQARSAG